MKPDLIFSIGVLFLMSSEAVTAQKTVTKSESQPLNPLSAISASDLKAFAERPLFEPSRRWIEPAKPATKVTEPAEDPAPDLVLLGITSGPDGTLARIASRTVRYSLREGENVGGWTLKNIEASSAVVEKGGETKTLRIFNQDDASAADLSEKEQRDSLGAGAGIVFETVEPSRQSLDLPSVRVIESK
jgi:hypothetical protein